MNEEDEARPLRRRTREPVRDVPGAPRHAAHETIHLTLTPERLALVRP